MDIAPLTAVSAFAAPVVLVGGVLLLWCRLRYGARLWCPVLASCLLTGPLAATLVSASAAQWPFLYLPLGEEARNAAEVLLVGIREEGVKLLLVLAVAWRDPEVRGAADRLMTMTTVALSFAVAENIMTMHEPGGSPMLLFGFSLTRMLQAVPLHVLASLQVAALIIRAQKGSRWWFAALPAPALLHSLWDHPLGLHGEMAQLAARYAVELLLAGGAVLLCRGLSIPPAARSARVLCASLLTALVIVAVLNEVLALQGWHIFMALRPVEAAPLVLLSWLILLIDSLLPTPYSPPRRRARA